MDYEDDDFQSQSFQLAGEENINFSSDLQSYTLPKFDLDDSLQVHLRFDSLVESEVLLGIQSQENQWVRDFSRESSGLDFSSSAAESCSISRCNNVWSEATSLESVDLLLKSVGQDEMIIEKASMEGSNVCDGVNNLTNQTTPNLNQDGSLQSKIENAASIGSALPPAKCSASFTKLGKDAINVLPQFDVTVQSYVGEKSGNGSSNETNPCYVGEKCNLEVSKRSPCTVEKCSETEQKEGIPLVDMCERNEIGDVLFASENSDTRLQDSAAKFGNSIDQHVPLQAGDRKKDDSEKVGDHWDDSEESQMNSQNYEKSAVQISANGVENEASLVLKADSMGQMRKVSGGAASSHSNVQVMKWVDVGDRIRRNVEGKVVEGDNSSVAHSCNIDSRAAGNVSVCVQKLHSEHIKQILSSCESPGKEGDLLKYDGQKMGVGASLSDSGISSIKEKTLSHDQGNQSSHSHVYGSSSRVGNLCLSSDIIPKSQTVECKDSADCRGTLVMDFDMEPHSSSPLESVRKCAQLLTEIESSELHISHPGVHSLAKENDIKSSPSHSVNVEIDIDNSTRTGERSHFDGLGVHSAELAAKDHISSHILTEPMQKIDKSVTETRLIDVPSSNSDVSSHEKENVTERLPADSVNAENTIGDLFVMDKRAQGDRLGIHSGTGEEAQVSSRIQVESMPKCDQILIDVGMSDVHISSTDVYVSCNENERLLTDSVDVDSSVVVDKRGNTSSYQAVSGISDSTGIAAKVVDAALDNNFDHFLHGNIAKKQVILGKDDGRLNLPVEDSVFLIRKEETVKGPCYPAARETSQMSNKSILHNDLKKGSVCDDAEGMLTKNVYQSSSSVVVTNLNQDACQSLVADRSVKQFLKGAEECSVIHDFPTKENEGSEVFKENEGPSKAVSGDPLNGCECSTCPETVNKGYVEVNALDVGSNSPNSNERSCGSPTIISCCEASQSEKEHHEGGTRSFDQVTLDAGHGKQEANEARYTATDSKENDTPGDDKSFTFKVSSRPDVSERETGKGWKPFPEIQPFSNPQISGVNGVYNGPKSDVEEKARVVAAQGTDMEPSGGIPLKETLPQKKEKQQVVKEIIDQIAIVSNNKDQVGDVAKSSAPDFAENRVTEVGKIVSFEVSTLADLSRGDTFKKSNLFTSVQPYEFRKTVEMSSTSSSLAVQEDAREVPRSSGAKHARRSPKGNVQDKMRLSSSKISDKENVKGGKVLKEKTTMKQTKERGSNSSIVPTTSRGGLSHIVQAEGSLRTFAGVPIQTSNLLSTSPSSAAFRQPFTDFQQVQLRAQIFVYGSLIQGTLPDEACMIAAFGESDKGRRSWENVWRAAVEKHHNQKSPLSARVIDQATRQSVRQSETEGTPHGAASKGPSPMINTLMPLSSPAWTVSTPSRDGLPLNHNPVGALVDFHNHKPLISIQPYQSPHFRQFLGNTTQLSQAPSPGTWVVTPPTVAAEVGAKCTALPISETIRVTAVRESSVSHPSGLNHGFPSPFPRGPSSGSAATTSLMEVKRTTSSPSMDSFGEAKHRKKKSVANEKPGPISSHIQSQPDLISGPVHSPTSLHITSPITAVSEVVSTSFTSPGLPVSSTNYLITGVRDTIQRFGFSEEMYSKTELAKKQAEDAAALASSAARHSHSLWSQLASEKSSGVAPSIEAKLSSLAVAVAAAASVAKAAAAAAKVASDAALQATLMANEALVISRCGDPTIESSIQDSVKKMGRVTPASILKGMDRSDNPDLVLVAAREAARKRVETASAAAKRAENLDAILKAAQIAAESVSQAGTIIAMGEPLPLTLRELINAGPEGYWKMQQMSSTQLLKSNPTRTNKSIGGDVEEGLEKHVQKEKNDSQDQVKVPHSKEVSKDSVENPLLLVNCTHSEKDSMVENDSKMSTSAETTELIPESQNVLTNDKDIKEGSLVEVLSDGEGLKRAWVSAKVLSLKDREAYVCYTEHVPNQGSGQLIEWVSLEGKDGKPPRVRSAHPLSIMKNERTKKRRRVATGDYTWSVGDKVDAWIHYGWREGVITAKINEDETNLTVCFPDQGDSLVVKAWDLRPSLIWEDGQWIQWYRSSENGFHPFQGETPIGKPPKRSRLGPEVDPAIEERGRQVSDNLMMDEPRKPEASKPLVLTSKEKVFTVGKNNDGEKRSDALKTKHTGMQKEGSGVIIGVPKPGKKRKFMEVSKHYTAGSKIDKGTDSIKIAEFLIPQDSASRGWKTHFKNVSKGKRVVEPKGKVISSGKIGRNTTDKGDNLTSVPESKHGVVRDHLSNVRVSASHDGSIQQKQMEVGHVPNNSKTATGATSFSSFNVATHTFSSRMKSSSAVATDPKGKRKAAPSGMKSIRNVQKDAYHNDDPGQPLPNPVEPRRSNRRIQPTSRLLEGLQSSLTISKIPAVSHEKGTKAHPRSSS